MASGVWEGGVWREQDPRDQGVIDSEGMQELMKVSVACSSSSSATSSGEHLGREFVSFAMTSRIRAT